MTRIPQEPSGEPNPLQVLTLDRLRERTSAKWRTYPEDVLPLWVAEMDVPLAEPVVRAVTDALTRGDTGYAAGTGFAEALSAFASVRWGWDGLAVPRTAVVPDVMQGVVEMLRLVTGPGDAVVVNPPVYPPFYSFVTHLDRRVVEAPLGPDGRLDLDVVEDTFRRVTEDGRQAAHLLCSPQNPTGTVHTREELSAVARLAERHGVRVVADEAHAPLVLGDASFVPYLSVPGAERGLSLMSASKAWNLAGIRAALAVAGPAAADDLARLPDEVADSPNHLGVIAQTAALTDGTPWLDSLLTGLRAQRDLLSSLLAEQLPALGYRPGDATYLAWLDCRALGLGDDPARVFLERGRVALNPGPDFGTGGRGHVRLNFATSAEVLTRAVRAMARAVDGRAGEG
ncbi:aminotransferase class I/II-fold pyridoxal phosphate-dependent enzyme [Streptomyces sp. NPDC029526]|uniref:MalY/PatB family protein n=1 Tax=Streptomyces sp. NPDC029526 TaxID=3155728 RepID=UPI0033EEE2B4